MSLIGKSRAHLDCVQETYWEHMRFALYALWMLLSAAVLLFIHLIVPAWFQYAASDRIIALHAAMMERRRQRADGT